jgi:hypothetical protein
MTHLNDTEFIDVIEEIDLNEEVETLAVERRRHVESCDECRARVEALRHTLAQALDADVPEPSPLFWDHFGARVSQAVNEAGNPARSSFLDWLKPANWRLPKGRESSLRWAEAGAVSALVVAVGIWALVARLSTPPGNANVVTSVSRPAATDATTDIAEVNDDIEVDEAWALVRTIADDVSWDETLAAGINARPGSADRALMQLTREERSELIRLLKAEMKQPGV